MEIWKPLRNFPSYNGSSEGRIMNIRTQKILSPGESPDGSMKVCLQKNNQQYTQKVCRLIAETFLGEHPGMDVRHRDLDPTNNRVDNLYWTTRSETIRDAYQSGTKRAWRQVSVRGMETGEVYNSIKECSRALRCDPSYIRQHLSGEREHIKGLHLERE